MKFTKKIISILLLIIILLMSTQTLAAIPSYGEEYKSQVSLKYDKVFNDVPKSYWAFDYIMEMVSRGVLSGYPNGNFYPNNTITRAEFSKIMCIASGLTVTPVTSTSYKDVNIKNWYAPYVEAGKYYLSGYVSGNEKYYLPESNALREDIAVALVKLKGYDTSLYDESLLKTMFTDWQSISQGARKYVSVAVEKGLISGYDDDTFRGQNSVTRAEAATLLWRAYQYGNENKIFDKEELDMPGTTLKPETLYPENDTNDNIEEDYTQDQPNNSQDIEEDIPEYLYELKTVGSGITDITTIIATNNGAFYLYGDDVYEVSKDGNRAEILLDTKNLEYLGTKELTKAHEANLRSYVTQIGYDPSSDTRYCIIHQVPLKTIVLYNLDAKTYVDITEIMSDDELVINKKHLFRNGMRFIIDQYGNIMCGSIIIDYINNKIRTVDMILDGSIDQLYVNNNIYITKRDIGESIYEYNTRDCSAKKTFDYYIKDNPRIIGADNKCFYFQGNNNIYKINTYGEEETMFSVDDIDNVDGKKITIEDIKFKTSSVSPNGVIYYWDQNYNCIRQLSRN